MNIAKLLTLSKITPQETRKHFLEFPDGRILLIPDSFFPFGEEVDFTEFVCNLMRAMDNCTFLEWAKRYGYNADSASTLKFYAKYRKLGREFEKYVCRCMIQRLIEASRGEEVNENVRKERGSVLYIRYGYPLDCQPECTTCGTEGWGRQYPPVFNGYSGHPSSRSKTAILREREYGERRTYKAEITTH